MEQEKKTIDDILTSDGSPVCDGCGGFDFITDKKRGEITCIDCGLVKSDRIIDEGKEWRTFSSDERDSRSRTGLPEKLTMFDKGLSTDIGRDHKDASGRSLTATKRSEMYRLRKWQIRTRVHDSFERNLAYAMPELERVSSHMGIPDNIQDTAAKIYRRAVKKKLTRGPGMETIICASLYIACRLHKKPRPLDAFLEQYLSDSSNEEKRELVSRRDEVDLVTKKKIGTGVRNIIRYTALKRALPDPEMILPDPVDCVPYITGRIEDKKQERGISDTYKGKAIDILNELKDTGRHMGKDPWGLAAASVYIAVVIKGSSIDKRITQRDIAEAAYVTEVTVRNRYKEILGILGPFKME